MIVRWHTRITGSAERVRLRSTKLLFPVTEVRCLAHRRIRATTTTTVGHCERIRCKRPVKAQKFVLGQPWARSITMNGPNAEESQGSMMGDLIEGLTKNWCCVVTKHGVCGERSFSRSRESRVERQVSAQWEPRPHRASPTIHAASIPFKPNDCALRWPHARGISRRSSSSSGLKTALFQPDYVHSQLQPRRPQLY